MTAISPPHLWVSLILCINTPLMGTNGLQISEFTLTDLCDSYIGEGRLAGRIEFDSWSLFMPDSACAWKLYAVDSNSYLQLNFTSFDLNPLCKDSNLSVWDGEIRDGPMKGLPQTFCGTNSTLITTTFTSNKNFISMKFSKNVLGKIYRSMFTLVFTSFKKDPCTPGDSEIQCDNGRCIASSLQCEGLNPCGDNTDCKGDTTASENSIFDILLAGIKSVLPYLAAVVGLFILYQIFKALKPRILSLRNHCNWLSNNVSHQTSGRDTQHAPEAEAEDDLRMTTLERQDEISDESSEEDDRSYTATNNTTDSPPDYSHVTESTAAGGSGNASFPAPSAPPVDDAGPPLSPPPPPSYEEAMSNQDVYKYKQ